MLEMKIERNTGCPNKEFNTTFIKILRPFPDVRKICIDHSL